MKSTSPNFDLALGEDRIHSLGRREELRHQFLTQLLQILRPTGVEMLIAATCGPSNRESVAATARRPISSS